MIRRRTFLLICNVIHLGQEKLTPLTFLFFLPAFLVSLHSLCGPKTVTFPSRLSRLSQRSTGCPTGNTAWRETCFVTSLPASINSAINTLLPEGKHPDSSLISANIFVVFTEGNNNNMSVTYLQSVAGWANRMGYAKYNAQTQKTTNPSYAIQKTNTNSGSGCLVAGDTWRFGPFVGDDMLVFFLDANSNDNARYWSYFAPGITNPSSDISTCGSPGCVHSAWAYLTDYDLTIFGWEDQSLGDADYNDLVFYLTLQGSGYYNEVPSYENGTVLVCNNNTIVSWNSFTDVDCQSWGLLETATGSGSCLTYMAIPSGWTWAPDDQTSKDIILASYLQWAYTGASTCYLLSVSPTQGAGYNVNTGTNPVSLQSCTATVKYITPGGQTIAPGLVTPFTPLCYNTECTARYVLKSISQSVACASVTRCDSSKVGIALQSTPTDYSPGIVTLPDSVTAWIATGTGSLDVAASLKLVDSDATNPKIDVVVLTDLYVDTTNSGQGQRSYIDSSWSSIGPSFRSFNMDVKFAKVHFVPSNNAASAGYSLTSDYSFSSAAGSMPDSAYHKISCGASDSAILRRGQNLVNAINAVATASALNWRSDAYRVVWVHTLCPLPANGQGTSSSLSMRSIQQLTGIVPVIALGSVSSNTPTFAAAGAPWQYSYYYSGQSVSWDSPFRSYSYTPNRGAYLFAQYLKTFQVIASQGDINWITNLGSSPVAVQGGAASFTYTISWPSSVPVTTTTLYYRASMQILGRDTVSYLIYFNHAPTMSPYTTTMTPQVSSVTFTMGPSDLDQGNQLNLIVKTRPTGGSLVASNGVTITTNGQALPVNIFTFTYTPTNRLNDYADSFVISVSDGCKVVDTTNVITVQKINQKPVANNVTVTMTEDATAATGFSLSMSDPEGQALTGYLVSAAYVSSGNVRVGNLAQTASSTTYYTTGALPSANLFYKLVATNGLTGYGQILIAYQAYDGSLYSNTAYIIVNVNHKNHAPVVTASTTITNKLGETIGWTVQVSDADYAYPGETATLSISSSTWGTSTNAYVIQNYGATTFTYNGQATPAALSSSTNYATGQSNITYSGSTLTYRGFSWTAPTIGVTPPSQVLTITATDKAGLTGSVTITFTLSNLNPPVWSHIPGTVDGTKTQGSTWNGIYFAAFDADGQSQMTTLTYKVISAPANGNAYLQAAGGATSATALKAGDTFTSPVGGTYASYNASGVVSDFRIRYTGNAAFYGTDSVTFSVTDTSGLSPSGYATASFVTTRIPTPPISANFSINAYEEQLTSFAVVAQSTNNLAFPVQIILEEVNLVGKFYQTVAGVNQAWTVGVNSTQTATNGGSVPGALQGDIGTFSATPTTPAGYFLYRVYEAENNLLSTSVYQASIFITHVNHAPQSTAQTDRIKKRAVLTKRLPASDADADGTDANLDAAILSLLPYNNGPPMYFDAEMTDPITSDSISTGRRLTDRTFYYQSNDLYDNSLPLMQYTFRVFDQYDASSDIYAGYIYVSAAGDLPIVGTNVTVTPQETPVPMNLAVDVTTESTQTPTVKITSLPTKGTFSYCDDFGACTPFGTTLPFTLTSTTGRVVYVPEDNNWGENFTQFTYTLTDPGTGAVGTYTMTIDVTHVNKAPKIFAANFLTTAETTTGIIINESEWRSFDWYVTDVDDLPSNLTSQVRVSFYTTQGFSFFNCTYAAGTWSTQDCTFDASAPEAVRADFAKNARVPFTSFEQVSTDCPTLDALKARTLAGDTSRNCESHFRFAFVPTPLASYTPYVTITWNAVDGAGLESSTISALIFVKAVNNEPTITAPAQVVGAAGITNPFLRDSTAAATPIVVDDVDSAGNVEQLTLTVVSGKGNFTLPAAASCTAGAAGSYVCLDRIAAFNQWLPDVRFNVTSGDRATLRFIIDDLGNSGDWKPSPHLTANATTVVIINAAIAAPKGNSSTLAIAVGVAAGAGLLLLGALGFFLRNAVSPPDEDYFSAATAPISAAPQSPLYQAQNTEHMSPLYKGNA